MLEKYVRIHLKDGREGVIVDYLGEDYVVDIGESQENWDTVIVKPEDIAD